MNSKRMQPLTGLWEPPGNRAAMAAEVSADAATERWLPGMLAARRNSCYWLYRGRWIIGGDLSDLVMMTQFVDLAETE